MNRRWMTILAPLAKTLSVLSLTFVALVGVFQTTPVQAGEWESSGAPAPPYWPSSFTSAHCEVRVSRQIGSDYLAVTTAYDLARPDESRSDIEQTTKPTDTWMKEDARGKSPFANAALQKWLGGHRLSLYFAKNYKTGEERVFLNLNVQGPKTDPVVTSWSSTSAPYAVNGKVDAISSVRIQSKKSKSDLSLAVQATCETR